jgi:hypothetical protein
LLTQTARRTSRNALCSGVPLRGMKIIEPSPARINVPSLTAALIAGEINVNTSECFP